MLQGRDPVIIFQFSKLVEDPAFIGPQDSSVGRIPLPYAADIGRSFIEQPPIPIYLSEALTGLFIDSQTKSVDIGTTTETTMTGAKAKVIQKGVGSTVQVNVKAVRDSIGVMLLGSMIDLLFDKVTSGEYAITYINGATTIFRAKLNSFSTSDDADTTKVNMTFELTRGESEPEATQSSVPSVSASEFPILG